ncbi:hypothetical protein IWQ60_011168 [Tieghemiomyces parasiticus]|uniref:Maintenance of telomere capping protein 1 n=1 Tax=Tieghemiomyces parasiticus TaxID=78921 RepID=A0A9W8DLU5_9FUNG|nr:hypothetical protein IWQ60_011168 [Tieghemiomyces parasiticus]
MAPPKPRHRKEDLLQFLDSLDLNDEAEQGGTETSPVADDIAASPQMTAASPTSARPACPVEGDKTAATAQHDSKSMHKFIDDLTASARNSLDVPSPHSPTRSNPTAAAASPATPRSGPTDDSAQTKPPADTHNWSWNSLWNTTSHLVKTQVQAAASHNAVQSTYNTMRGALDQARAAEPHRHLDTHVRNLDLQGRLAKLSHSLRGSVNSVMDTLAPPISPHEVFNVSYAINLNYVAGVEHIVTREFEIVMDHYHVAEALCKPSESFQRAEELHSNRHNKLTIPKGFEAGFHHAQRILDNMIETDRSGLLRASRLRADENTRLEPHRQKAHHSPILLVLQPCAATPVSGVSSIFVCGLLYDPNRNITVKNISQSLALDGWIAQAKDPEGLENDIVTGVITMCIKELARQFMDQHQQVYEIIDAEKAAAARAPQEEGAAPPVDEHQPLPHASTS